MTLVVVLTDTMVVPNYMVEEGGAKEGRNAGRRSGL